MREYFARKIWKLAKKLDALTCTIRGRHIDWYDRETLTARCGVCGIKKEDW